jgi:hypothetical protein
VLRTKLHNIYIDITEQPLLFRNISVPASNSHTKLYSYGISEFGNKEHSSLDFEIFVHKILQCAVCFKQYITVNLCYYITKDQFHVEH